jgi:hypothetical protein
MVHFGQGNLIKDEKQGKYDMPKDMFYEDFDLIEEINSNSEDSLVSIWDTDEIVAIRLMMEDMMRPYFYEFTSRADELMALAMAMANESNDKTDAVIARADAVIAEANEQIAEANEQIARSNEQISEAEEQHKQIKEQIKEIKEDHKQIDERLKKLELKNSQKKQKNSIETDGFLKFIKEIINIIISSFYIKNESRSKNETNDILTSRTAMSSEEVSKMDLSFQSPLFNKSNKHTEELENEVKIVDDNLWKKKHIKTLKLNYPNASPKLLIDIIEIIENATNSLIELNLNFINFISNYLNIEIKSSLSSSYPVSRDQNMRLVELCKSTNSNMYLSGPAARSYLSVEIFESEDITVKWFDFDEKKQYPQRGSDFIPYLSILDLILNNGQLYAESYVKSQFNVSS